MSMNSSTDAVCDRAAGADDTESYQEDFAYPSPPRPSYGHNVHLERRSPPSSYSSSQQSAAADAGFHRRRSFSLESTDAFPPTRETTPIPSVGDSCHKDCPCLRRHLSLDCTGGKLILPPEVSNQTRRTSSLESTAAFPPPLPLGRIASDPVRHSSLVNHVLPARETTQVPSSDSKNSPTAEPRPLAPAASSILPNSPYGGFDSTQETPSFKQRQKRADTANKIRQQMHEIEGWIDQMVKEDSAIIDFPIAPETEIPAEKTVNNTNEAPLEEEALDKEKQEEEDLEADADVKARKEGECTMLDFKCRCGSSYSVAILGNSFFYKLI